MPAVDLSPNAFSRILELYLSILESEELSQKTISGYRQRDGAFLRAMAASGISLDQITRVDVRLFLAQLKTNGCVATTIDAYFRSMRAFFNKMIVEGILQAPSPMAGMEAPKLPKLIPRTFTRDDIYKMMSLFPHNTFLGIRNRTVLLIFMDTGIRLAEMASIQLADIDREFDLIKIFGKGAKERVVPLGKTTQKMLLKYKTMFRSDPNDRLPCLWLTEEGRPLTRDGVQMMVRRLIRLAGITGVKVGPHAFRHFAATNYLMNGGDKSTLKTMLGHSTYQMVDRYSGSVETQLMQRVHKSASPVDKLHLF